MPRAITPPMRRREIPAGWYQSRAAEARCLEDWLPARWYLDWLIAARPREWRLYEQRVGGR